MRVRFALRIVAACDRLVSEMAKGIDVCDFEPEKRVRVVPALFTLRRKGEQRRRVCHRVRMGPPMLEPREMSRHLVSYPSSSATLQTTRDEGPLRTKCSIELDDASRFVNPKLAVVLSGVQMLHKTLAELL